MNFNFKKTITAFLLTVIFLVFGGFFNLALADQDTTATQMSAEHGACRIAQSHIKQHAKETINQALPCCVADAANSAQLFSLSPQKTINDLSLLLFPAFTLPAKTLNVSAPRSNSTNSLARNPIDKIILRI